jgi:ribosome-binding protein aMBF1 (putative translation factor)
LILEAFRRAIQAAAAARAGGYSERQPAGVMRLTTEKIKKTQNNKNGVDNKKVVCYIISKNKTKGELEMKKTALQAVKDIRENVGISQKKLAEKMELKSQQAVFNMLNAKNGMRVDNFVKLMEIMGYDVVVRNRVTDEEIEIVGDSE